MGVTFTIFELPLMYSVSDLWVKWWLHPKNVTLCHIGVCYMTSCKIFTGSIIVIPMLNNPSTFYTSRTWE